VRNHLQVLPLLAASAVVQVCERLLKLYHLHQRFLSRSATSVLSAAMAASDARCVPCLFLAPTCTASFILQFYDATWQPYARVNPPWHDSTGRTSQVAHQ
jgi:hypothetical protein